MLNKPFKYKITKSEKVLIFRNNKQIMTMKGQKAIKFQNMILISPESQVQLYLAKITGNYKHGNERSI